MEVQEDGKVLISETSAGRLYLYWEEYRGDVMLHIRYWYCDKKDGVWKPGMKGVALAEAKMPEILEGLKVVLQQRAEPQVPPEPKPLAEDELDIYG